jgi:hypothetical protein
MGIKNEKKRRRWSCVQLPPRWSSESLDQIDAPSTSVDLKCLHISAT